MTTKLLSIMLATAALAAVAAQPASADVPESQTDRVTLPGAQNLFVSCSTPVDVGTRIGGLPGLHVYYHDGCTATATCPARGCSVIEAGSMIQPAGGRQHVTLNQRIRMPDWSSGWWRDSSCALDTNFYCRADDSVHVNGWNDGAYLLRGQRASVQCNGTSDGPAHVLCSVRLRWRPEDE